jgi:hypothetical protein
MKRKKPRHDWNATITAYGDYLRQTISVPTDYREISLNGPGNHSCKNLLRLHACVLQKIPVLQSVEKYSGLWDRQKHRIQ